MASTTTPRLVYSPPVAVASNGAISYYANSSFTNAWINGYNTGAGTVNLETDFRAWTNTTTDNSGGDVQNTNAASGAAFYYTYSGSQDTAAEKNYLSSSSTFYQECNSLVGSTPGSTRVHQGHGRQRVGHRTGGSRRTHQLRQLVQLLPDAHVDDEDGHRPGLPHHR